MKVFHLEALRKRLEVLLRQMLEREILRQQLRYRLDSEHIKAMESSYLKFCNRDQLIDEPVDFEW